MKFSYPIPKAENMYADEPSIQGNTYIVKTPDNNRDYKGAILFTVCTIAFMASFAGIIIFCAWFTSNFIHF